MQEFLHQQYHPSIHFKPGHARKARHAQKRSEAKRSARKKEPPKEEPPKEESEKEFDDSATAVIELLFAFLFWWLFFRWLFFPRTFRASPWRSRCRRCHRLFRESEWSQRRWVEKQGVVSRFFFPKPTPTEIFHKGKSLKNLPYDFLKHSFRSFQNMDNQTTPEEKWEGKVKPSKKMILSAGLPTCFLALNYWPIGVSESKLGYVYLFSVFSKQEILFPEQIPL